MVEESYGKLCSLSTLVWSTSHLPSLSRIGYFHSTLRTFGHKITRIQCYGWTIIKHFPYTYSTRCYYFSLRRNRFGIFGNLDRCLFSFHDFEIEVQNSTVQIGEGRLACDYFSFVFGFLWDSHAILRGYWSFKEDFFIGVDIGVMPLEEYLFMVIIPFLVLVIYGIVTRKSRR